MIASFGPLADNLIPACSFPSSAMNRFAFAVGLMWLTAAVAVAAEPAARQPNILFILADDKDYHARLVVGIVPLLQETGFICVFGDSSIDGISCRLLAINYILLHGLAPGGSQR